MCAAKEISAMNKAGMQAMQDGNYINAEFMMHQAIRRAESLGVDTYVAKLKNNFGIILNMQGKHTEAAGYLSEALHTIEQKIGTENKLYNTIESNLREARSGTA
ncbi:MAG: tetratricopeptide repeat protein [Desulfovibrionales bacterium]|nr:tetratricopeptide repeat protein [Desulfovibrionales bacterium]